VRDLGEVDLANLGENPFLKESKERHGNAECCSIF